MEHIEIAELRQEVIALKQALDMAAKYVVRLKNERDGARAESAAVKSKLTDSSVPLREETLYAAAREAIQNPQGGKTLNPAVVIEGLAAAQKSRRESEGLSPEKLIEKAERALRENR